MSYKSEKLCANNCMIMDLIKSEHEQLKQRTEMIKNLMNHNCAYKNEIKPNIPYVTKHINSNSDSKKQCTKNNQPKVINSNICSRPACRGNRCPIMSKAPIKSGRTAPNILHAKHSEDKEKLCNLQKEISALRTVASTYEEEKADWIEDKRKQIKLLQELRDACSEETKAVVELTNLNISQSECSEEECEKAKVYWMNCKHKQIDLLEDLRTVTLCEIKKSMGKLNSVKKQFVNTCAIHNETNKTVDVFDRDKSPQCKQLYSNDLFSINLCSKVSTKKNTDDSKKNYDINISIDPESLNTFLINPNVFNNNNEIVNNKNANSNAISNNQPASIDSMTEDFIAVQEQLLNEIKNSIIDQFGVQLFESTYQMLKKLRCPELLLDNKQRESSSWDIPSQVYKYIKAEDMMHKKYLNNK